MPSHREHNIHRVKKADRATQATKPKFATLTSGQTVFQDTIKKLAQHVSTTA